jgi:hypothetical protein
MKILTKRLLTIISALFLFSNITFMKILNKMGEGNPCWKAYILKKQAAKEPDQFQRQLLMQEAEVNDVLCQEQNKPLYRNPKMRQ